MALSEKELEELAIALEKIYAKRLAQANDGNDTEVLRKTKTEQLAHALAHERLNELIDIWKTTQSIFIKTLIGLLILSALWFISIKYGFDSGQ